tara:strand:+ start:923 stop:1171 length:249 start_codon:yes stop_codon:yes gene_type:complete
MRSRRNTLTNFEQKIIVFGAVILTAFAFTLITLWNVAVSLSMLLFLMVMYVMYVASEINVKLFYLLLTFIVMSFAIMFINTI